MVIVNLRVIDLFCLPWRVQETFNFSEGSHTVLVLFFFCVCVCEVIKFQT